MDLDRDLIAAGREPVQSRPSPLPPASAAESLTEAERGQLVLDKIKESMDSSRLLQRHGVEHLVQAVVNWLRCGRPNCGRAPSFVRLQSRPD